MITPGLILGGACLVLFGVAIGGIVMGAFAAQEIQKLKRKRMIEDVGPDRPQVKMPVKIQEYTITKHGIVMEFSIQNATLECAVPPKMMEEYPAGVDAFLIFKKENRR